MQFKLAIVTAALATLACASPAPASELITRGHGGDCVPASSCSTGPIKCCETLSSATSALVVPVLGMLGIVLSNTDVNVGLNCLNVLTGGTCNAQAVCCSNNSHGKLEAKLLLSSHTGTLVDHISYTGTLISIGCIPVQL
ncbi:hypothetical protein D9757_008798 [Collybiopsis confluens]|uniref:Hydrophobin n=1 Tax=Collybiopsis confluens TaxID=2823264 RepID=A0A8H5M0V5_9AGAR|nr:hypothetical protein D9757_008798 [Collybiopsis confluens]